MHVCIDWTYWSIELMSRPETANHVLAGFFPGPRGPLKESSIPHPSFLPPVHHSSAIFILQDTLLIFKIQSKYFHFANISSPPQKKIPSSNIFPLSFFTRTKKYFPSTNVFLLSISILLLIRRTTIISLCPSIFLLFSLHY